MKTILIVDDESDFTELAETFLSFHGYAVDTLNSSEEVAEKVKNKLYDIIITDLMMPGMNGFELIQYLRIQKEYEKCVLIVLSAKSLTEEERKFLTQNDVHHFMKPFDPQSLIEHIKKSEK